MLAGFQLGFVPDRRLMRDEGIPATGPRGCPQEVNPAIRWFAGFGLTERWAERLPDHSSLTRIRHRWGEDLFRAIFSRVVQARPV